MGGVRGREGGREGKREKKKNWTDCKRIRGLALSFDFDCNRISGLGSTCDVNFIK